MPVDQAKNHRWHEANRLTVTDNGDGTATLLDSSNLFPVYNAITNPAGFNVGDYCHDGLFLGKSNGDRDKVEQFFKVAMMRIKNETTFDVNFSIKDMDYEQPWTSDGTPKYVPLDKQLTDHYLTERFKVLMNERIRYCCKTLWIYDTKECIWCETEREAIMFNYYVPMMTDYINALPCDEETKTAKTNHIASAGAMNSIARSLSGAFVDKSFISYLSN